MTDDEVALIYDYLHANYEYRDGELIAKYTKSGTIAGQKIGSLNYHDKASPCFMVHLKIKNKRYSRSLHQYIYLYHHKTLQSYVRHIDGNITNNKIENLIVYTKGKSNENRPFLGYEKNKNGWRVNMTWDKKKQTYGNFIDEYIAKNVSNYVRKLRYNKKLSHNEIKLIINKEFGAYMYKNNIVVKGYKERWGRFVATMKVNNKSKHIGIFDTPEEAHAAYLKAKEEYASS